jgi:aspartyl-tRNA(Asn)/glutamyl-tRNA(Gln) amidotransferase subunit B
LLNAVHDDKISGRIAKDVFLKMYDTKKDYLTAVQELGVFQISDESALLSGAKKILVSNPVEVEAYRNGKTKLMGFFVGELMKETKGQANPGLANKIFKELLDKKSN